MLNGMTDSVKGCLKEELKMDVVSNNLANASVIGFKKDRIRFQDLLNEQINEQNPKGAMDPDMSPPTLVSITTDYGQGDVRATGNTFDFAIYGDGFFKISTPQGTRFTRKGNFRLDSQGLLVTQQGHMVMGKDGAITVSGINISVNDDGTILADGSELGRIDVVDFENYENLRKEGKGLYSNGANEPEKEPPPDTRIKQGYVELSNVNVAVEMVQMIRSLRTFESYQKAIQVIDELNRKAINDVSRLR